MVVAFGIFSAAMITAVGIMLGVIHANQKSSAVQAVIDNIRFSLELMTREMRTGTDFQIVNHGCSEQFADGIEFVDRNVPAVEGKRRYCYLADRLPFGPTQDGLPDTIYRVALSNEGPINCSPPIGSPFTSIEVLVESFQIKLDGYGLTSSDGQPRVTLSLRVKSSNERYQADSIMNLQTTVVQRLLQE